MTELLDFIFGLLSTSPFRKNYSKIAETSTEIKEPFRTTIEDVFRNHMQLDPATAFIQYDCLLVKNRGDKFLRLVALNDNKKVFTYICKNDFNYHQIGYGIIRCKKNVN